MCGRSGLNRYRMLPRRTARLRLTTEHRRAPRPQNVRHMQQIEEREHYLNASYGLKSWLLTKDHKRIGLLYLFTVTLFFFLGGAFATLIRVELLTPQGDLVSADTCYKLFTMHGVAMEFFFLIPAIPA